MYILYCIYIFEIQRKIDVASRVVTVQNVTFPNEKSNFLTSILMILSKKRLYFCCKPVQRKLLKTETSLMGEFSSDWEER